MAALNPTRSGIKLRLECLTNQRLRHTSSHIPGWWHGGQLRVPRVPRVQKEGSFLGDFFDSLETNGYCLTFRIDISCLKEAGAPHFVGFSLDAAVVVMFGDLLSSKSSLARMAGHSHKCWYMLAMEC